MDCVVLDRLTGLPNDHNCLGSRLILLVPAQHPDLIQVLNIVQLHWDFVSRNDLHNRVTRLSESSPNKRIHHKTNLNGIETVLSLNDH